MINMLNNGYEVPNTLVFLKPEDYERLNAEGTQFIYQRNADDHRNPFERDRARILHSPLFRSLSGKSQVFGPNQSDFFRNRLTHSLEVAQIAKVMVVEICEHYRASGFDLVLSPWEQTHFCDLVEAVCLAHDIGHPPFGHIGEDTLNQLMQEQGGDGFEANAQNLRALTKLDESYPERPGFTRGVLAGVMKYKIKRNVGLKKFIYDDDWLTVEMTCPWWRHDNSLHKDESTNGFETRVKRSRTIACQLMDIADELTYAGHDLEDVLHSPLLRYGVIEALNNPLDQLAPGAIDKIRFEVEIESGCLLNAPILQEGWRQLQHQILEVFKSKGPSEFNIRSHQLRRTHMNSGGAYCRAEADTDGNWQIRIPQETALRSALIRHVVIPLVHHDSRLMTLQRKGARVIQALFKELSDNGDKLLPWHYKNKFASAPNSRVKARICCDFIAGMTEDYALRLYQRLFEAEHGLVTDFF